MKVPVNREQIGYGLMIEKDHCYVNHDYIPGYLDESIDLITREEAVKLFNDIAEENGYNRSLTPEGYMAQPYSIYNSIKDTYYNKYAQTRNDVEKGYIDSYVQPFDYALERITSTKRNNMVVSDMSNFLPKEISFGELRFLKTNPEINESIEELVDSRIQMTIIYSKSRDYKNNQFQEVREDFMKQGEKLVEQIKEVDEKSTLFKTTINNEVESSLKQDDGLVM